MAIIGGLLSMIFQLGKSKNSGFTAEEREVESETINRWRAIASGKKTDAVDPALAEMPAPTPRPVNRRNIGPIALTEEASNDSEETLISVSPAQPEPAQPEPVSAPEPSLGGRVLQATSVSRLKKTLSADSGRISAQHSGRAQ